MSGKSFIEKSGKGVLLMALCCCMIVTASCSSSKTDVGGATKVDPPVTIQTSNTSENNAKVNKAQVLTNKEYVEYIKSVNDLLSLGPKLKTWSNAEQVDPDKYFQGFLYQKLDEIDNDRNIVIYEKPVYYISAKYYENYVKQFFNVTSEFLQKSPHYSLKHHCYFVNVSELGFGDAGDVYVIKDIKPQNDKIVAVTTEVYEEEVAKDKLQHIYTYYIDQSTRPYKWVGLDIIK